MVQAENAILVYENQAKIASLSDIFTFFLCHASSVKTILIHGWKYPCHQQLLRSLQYLDHLISVHEYYAEQAKEETQQEYEISLWHG